MGALNPTIAISARDATARCVAEDPSEPLWVHLIGWLAMWALCVGVCLLATSFKVAISAYRKESEDFTALDLLGQMQVESFQCSNW